MSGTPITNDDLQAFADEALAPARRSEVAAYLEHNADAAVYVARIVTQNASLRAATAPLLDPAVPPRMRIAHLVERERSRSRLGLWAGGRAQIAASLVACLLLGGGVGWGLHPSASPFRHGVRPLVEEAADTYAVYEPDRLHPVEIAATDKDALMQWATDRLRRRISAPDTIDAYKLLGGRVVATSRGPAAMFMYQHGDRRIVLMICPLSLHGTAPISASTQGDLEGVSWSTHGVGYSLVGALPGGVLQRMAEAVRRQTGDRA